MLVIAGGYSSPLVEREAVGLSQLLGLCTAVLFLWSADVVPPHRLRSSALAQDPAVIGLWFLFAPLVFGAGAVLTPGYLATAIVLAAAGSMYAAVLLERRMIGAGLVAFVLFGLAISNVSTAAVLRRTLAGGTFPVEMLTVSAVLYAFGALGVHLLVFEDMTYELRLTNRRLETAREDLLQAAITDPLTGCPTGASSTK